MATQTNLNLAQSLYIAYYGRAADSEGLAYWAGRIEEEGVGEILNAFGTSAEYQDRFSEMSNDALIENLYLQMFDRLPDFEGFQFYKELLESGEKSLAQIAFDILSGAQEPDTTTLANKVEAANAYTAEAGEDYVLEDGIAAVRDANVEPPEEPETTLTLTQRADDLKGQDGVDNTFVAPVTQNETGSGQLANTFETGDKLDGGADSVNSLYADLIGTGTIQDSILGITTGAPIHAETTNIQNVFLTAQSVNLETGGTTTTVGSTIDAGRMEGVEQWWSDNSRADILIEDIRSRPTDTAFGLRESDPNVSYAAAFNPLFLFGDESAESQLVIQIAELDGGNVNAGAQLDNIRVSALTFELDGEPVTITSDAMADANKWDELQAAIVDALEDEGLGDLTVEHLGNGEFLLFDAEGRPFSDQGGFSASATTNQQIDIRNRISQDLETEEGQTETALILDGAGNGSQGGAVDLGVMSGNRGVEVFNVVVDRDSHVVSLSSSEYRTGTNFLEEVNLTNTGADGDVIIGNARGTGFRDDRAINGLTDVRAVDASGFAGEANIGINLNGFGSSLIQSYFADQDGEPVEFSYQGGDGGNTMTFSVNNGLASDPDFRMEILGGASDDRFNLVGAAFDLNNVTIDGGEGSNILETSSSINVGGATTPASVDNIQTLILAGNNTVNAGMAGELAGVEQLVIATSGSQDSQIVNVGEGLAISIDGKNQLGNDLNTAQNFGEIDFNNANAEEITVDLDNRARVEETLTVDEMNVTGANSNASTLNVNSNGARQTDNVISSMALAGITTLTFAGSQDLAASVVSIGDATDREAGFEIDGSALEGNLTLGVNAASIQASNDVDGTVSIDGSENTADRLNITNITGAITSDTSVSDFATVGLTSADPAANVDVASFSDVELYIVDGSALEVTSLRNGDTVRVDNNQTLDLEGPGSGALNVNLNAGDRTGDLIVSDFATLNLDVNEGDHAFDLILDDVARNLNITGGDESATPASLELIDELPTTLSVIDFSGYQGTVDLSMGDSGTDNSDTRFVLGAEDADIDLSGSNPGWWLSDGNNDWNAIFEFTSAPTAQVGGNPAVTWTIEDFVTEFDGNVDSYSVLDLSALGIESFADLDFDDSVANQVTITEEGGNSTWEIVLTGITNDSTDLAPSENFIFA